MVAPSGAQPCPTTATTYARGSRIDEHQGFAAQAVEILLDHPTDQQRRDAGVERIAAAGKYLERCRRGQRMARRHTAIAPHDGWTLGGADGRDKETAQRESREGTPNDQATKNDHPTSRSR